LRNQFFQPIDQPLLALENILTGDRRREPFGAINLGKRPTALLKLRRF
jgi:hypothetical protein